MRGRIPLAVAIAILCPVIAGAFEVDETANTSTYFAGEHYDLSDFRFDLEIPPGMRGCTGGNNHGVTLQPAGAHCVLEFPDRPGTATIYGGFSWLEIEGMAGLTRSLCLGARVIKKAKVVDGHVFRRCLSKGEKGHLLTYFTLFNPTSDSQVSWINVTVYAPCPPHDLAVCERAAKTLFDHLHMKGRWTPDELRRSVETAPRP